MATPEEQDFERTARIPLIWQITARQLIASANRLRHGHEEAKQKILKGVLVAQGTLPVVQDKKKGSLKLNHEIYGHNLESLCRKAGLTLDSTDQEVLNSLSWTVKAGKYPIGTKPAIAPDDPPPIWLELTNLNRACQILNRLEAALRATGQSWVLEEVDLCAFGL